MKVETCLDENDNRVSAIVDEITAEISPDGEPHYLNVSILLNINGKHLNEGYSLEIFSLQQLVNEIIERGDRVDKYLTAFERMTAKLKSSLVDSKKF